MQNKNDTPQTKTRRSSNVASAAKAAVTVDDDGSTTEDDVSSDEEEEFFDDDELKRFHPGYIIVKDLKRGESTLDRYNSIPEGFTSRSKIVNKMVAIPAIYWGGIESLKKDKWWKTPVHTKELRKLTLSEIENALLIGKVIQSGKKGCWEVALICAKNEVSMIYGKDIRNFLYAPDDNSNPKKRSSNALGSGNEKGAGRKRTKVNEEDLIEEDEFESEDDLQHSDGDGDDSDSDGDDSTSSNKDNGCDLDFVRVEPRTKEERVWTVVRDVRSTNYCRPYTQPFVNCVSISEWKDLTPWNLFEMQLPRNEFELWAELTSRNLKKLKKPEVDVAEMKVFIGCLFSCTQMRKVGGITKAFETFSDGLFPPQDLGRFGMSLRRFQDIMRCWEFADDQAKDVDIDDEYWRTEQLFDRFNERYAKIITHGTYVNVDERIFWSYCRAQPGGVKICGRKPKGTGQEAKTLSCVDLQVTTTFEHVRGNSTNPYVRDLMKEYGKAASVVLRLCKKAKIEGSNRIVIADSWFANLSLYRGVRKYGLHLIGMIKQGDGGFPKEGLCKILDDEKLERGSHVTATTTIEREQVIAVAWKGKSDKAKKSKSKRKFWVSTFIASDCTTTLPGNKAEKKRHTPEGTRAESVFVKRPKLVEEYYNGMPGTDIVNRNAQFLIGLEEAIRTRDIHKRMCCTILGTWMANAYGMAMRFFSSRKKMNMSTANFVREVILEGLFEYNKLPLQMVNRNILANENETLSTMNQSTSIQNQSNNEMTSLGPLTIPSLPEQSNVVIDNGASTVQSVNEMIDSRAIDPFVHTMQRFDELTGVTRQQRCVMCIQEKRRTMTSYYCSLCCVTAVRDEERRPPKHAYCINPKYNCFARHTARCYRHMNRTGGAITTSRKQLYEESVNDCNKYGVVPITGRVVSRTIPKRRKQSRRNRSI